MVALEVKKAIRKIKFICLVGLVCLIGTGCGGSLGECYGDVTKEVSERAAPEIQAVDDLWKAGVISDQTKKAMQDSINANVKAFMKLFENGEVTDSAKEKIMAAVVWSSTGYPISIAPSEAYWPELENGERKAFAGDGTADTSHLMGVLHNYLVGSEVGAVSDVDGFEGAITAGTLRNLSGNAWSNLSGIDFYSTENEKSDNKATDKLKADLSRQIYILKSNSTDDYMTDMTNIANAIYICKEYEERIDKGKKGDSKITDVDYKNALKVIQSTFKPTGTTLFDLKANQKSKGNPDAIPISIESYSENFDAGGGKEKNTLGSNLVLHSDGRVSTVCSVRGLNPNLIDEILAIENPDNTANKKISGYKYVAIHIDGIDSETSETVLLKMEYPLYYIDGVKVSDSKGKEFKSSLNKSDLKVNLYTGKLLNNNGDEVKLADEDDPILQIDATDKTGSKSSFIVASCSEEQIFEGKGDKAVEPGAEWTASNGFDEGGVTYKNIGYNKKEVTSCLAIILADYLELTYKPGIVTDEDFVALGRRLRVKSLHGKASDIYAEFVDRKGALIPDAKKVYVSDLIQPKIVNASKTDGKTKEEKEYNKKSYNTLKIGIHANSKDIIKQNNFSKKQVFNRAYKEQLDTTLKFPSDELDKADASEIKDINKYDKMVFYGMATNISEYDSALYSGWIKNQEESSDEGNVRWWVGWLSSNNYSYTLDLNAVATAYGITLTFNVEDENIRLDTSTLVNIQNDIDNKQKSEQIKSIRTFAVIVGLVLMTYAMLLIGAWAFDTTIVAGPKLLTILTFGKWVAITNSDEVGYFDIDNPSDENGKSYFKFSAILIRSCAIILIAIIFIRADVFEIIGWIYNILGGVLNSVKGLLGMD